MYIRAKLRDITLDDALQFAKDNGIRRPNAIIQAVARSLKDFGVIAQKNGVQERWLHAVESTINRHLASWGFAEKEGGKVEFEIEEKGIQPSV